MSKASKNINIPDDLTPDILLSLLKANEESEGQRMYGNVRPISIHRKCPICNQNFTEVKKLGYICLQHRTTPRKFFVDLWNPFKKKRIPIFRDEKGFPLDSYKRAYAVLVSSSREIEDKTFKVEKYKQEDPEQFYISTKWYEYSKRGLAFAYKNSLKYTLPKVIEFFGTDKDIRELEQSDVALFMKHLIKTGANYEGANQTIRVFLSVCNYNAKLGIGKKLCMTDIVDNDNDIPRKRKDAIPEITDTVKIISCMEKENRLPYLFNLLHFCRPADVRALQAGDFNFTNNTVTIQRSFSVDELHDLTKTGIEYTIPIHPQVLEKIRALCQTKNPDEFLWVMPEGLYQGEAWRNYYQAKLWKAARIKAGLPKVQMYKGTKHCGASEVANSSKDVLGTSKLIGHFGGTSNTEKYICRVDIEQLRELQEHISVDVSILD